MKENELKYESVNQWGLKVFITDNKICIFKGN